jgi:cell pole-organizing protein PopZ
MAKPETKPAQSLEEILASIRKALAEEEVQGVAERPSAAEPVPAVERPASAKGDALPGQLAVALNGSGSKGAAPDDDLADLLAPLPSKGASAAAAEAGASESAGGEKKDPLWFLARQPGAKTESAPKVEPVPDEKRHEPPEEAVPIQPDEVTLTRLETLRASLPPLFGAEEVAAIRTEPVSFTQPQSLKPVDLPEFAVPEKPKEEPRAVKAPVPDKVPVAQAALPEPAAPVPAPPPPASVPHPPAPAAPVIEAAAPVPAEPRRGTTMPAQSHALEDMIGQLIEPVIRSWLDANLARLVEKVVREEVARTSTRKPDRSND